MNKIALQLSGQPRSYKAAYPYIKKNLLDCNDVDVFYHTWREVIPFFHENDELYDLYKPVRHLDGSPTIFNNDLLNKRYCMVGDEKHPPCNTVKMFYSLYISNFLRSMHEKTCNIQYDWVVRCRFDYALNWKVDCNLWDPNLLYTAYEDPLCQREMITDQFAIAHPSIMNQYSMTFINLDEIVQNVQWKGGSGEDLITKNAKLYGLKYNEAYVDVKHPFPPGEFNGTPHSLIREDFRQWNNLR